MKLLHTSDWHLGRMLYSKKERSEEHAAFLVWLHNTIKEQTIDLLIIAGDIFDTVAPNNSVQTMYYDFLVKVRSAGCKNVIVVGGNHDSPSFLNAPKEVLEALQVHVLGNATENLKDELVVIKDEKKHPVAIVCAVPFLRERDLSRFNPEESYADRSKRINESIKNHYAAIANLACEEQQKTGKKIPIIATGHLSVAGGKTTENDGVRDSYIGNIECIESNIFPQIFDYVALGHYHIPSIIKENLRYSGSPIPMGFGEAEQQKSVYMVHFDENKPTVIPLNIPVFQRMESIRGDKACIEKRLKQCMDNTCSIWVEITYEGEELFPDFVAWANERIVNTKIEILKLQNKQYMSEVLTKEDVQLSLEEIDKFEVFDKLLEKNSISEEDKTIMKKCYEEIVSELTIEN